MDDIKEQDDLRDWALLCEDDNDSPGLVLALRRAADTIERLEAEKQEATEKLSAALMREQSKARDLKAAMQRIERLERERGELRAALEPFVEIAKELSPTLRGDYKNTMTWAVPTVGEFRRARAALKGGEAGGEGFVLAPLEPTKEMLDATQRNESGGLLPREYRAAIYRAMVSTLKGGEAPEPVRSEAWPNGCHKPNSCSRNGMCMYAIRPDQCRHFDRDIKAEIAAETERRTKGGEEGGEAPTCPRCGKAGISECRMQDWQPLCNSAR